MVVLHDASVGWPGGHSVQLLHVRRLPSLNVPSLHGSYAGAGCPPSSCLPQFGENWYPENDQGIMGENSHKDTHIYVNKLYSKVGILFAVRCRVAIVAILMGHILMWNQKRKVVVVVMTYVADFSLLSKVQLNIQSV